MLMVKSPVKTKIDKKGRFRKTSRLPSSAEATKGRELPQIFRKITAPRTELTSSRGFQPRGTSNVPAAFDSGVGGTFLRGNVPAFPTLRTWFNWRFLIILLIVSLLLINLIGFGQNLYSNYQEAQAKQAQKRAIEAEIAKWENVVRQRPNYRDAYFELAVLTYRLNRIEETKGHLNKVFELDPNFKPAKELERLLK